MIPRLSITKYAGEPYLPDESHYLRDPTNDPKWGMKVISGRNAFDNHNYQEFTEPKNPVFHTQTAPITGDNHLRYHSPPPHMAVVLYRINRICVNRQ